MDALTLITTVWLGASAFAALESPVAVLRYPGPVDVNERLTATAYNFDGTLIVAASESGRVQIWDTRTLSPRLKCDSEYAVPTALRTPGQRKTNQPWIRDVKFSPDGKRVAVSGPNGNVWLWTLSDGDCKAQNLVFLRGHTEDARSVEFSRDGRHVVTTSDDTTVRIWDAQGQLVKTIDLNVAGFSNAFTTSAAFSTDGKVIVAARSDGAMFKIDAETFVVTSLREGTPNDDAIWQVAFVPNGQTFATASEDGEVAIWTLGGVKQKVLRAAGRPGANSVAFTPDGLRLAVGLSIGSSSRSPSTTAQTLILKTADGEREHSFAGGRESISRVTFSPDGSRLATSAYDGTLHLWSMAR